MPFTLSEVNFAAVFAAGLVAFVVGAVWYTAIFGKLWVKLQAYGEERMAAMKARRPMPVFLGIMFVAYLVLAFAIAFLLTGIPERNALTGALVGAILWLGPAAAIGLTGHIATDRADGTYLIDVGCELVYLVLMGLILGAWHA
jgi:uncharacterized membrane protein